MTPAQRMRLEDIAQRHPWAPPPTPDDIRILLAEIVELEEALDTAVAIATESICERLLEKRP